MHRFEPWDVKLSTSLIPTQWKLASITMHMFNTVKKINQANKHSTIKDMNISAGDITMPKSCLKIAPYVSGI